MSRLSNLRSKLRASGTLIPRSIAIQMLARAIALFDGERQYGPNVGEPGIKKYRAWRKKRLKVAKASRRANRYN